MRLTRGNSANHFCVKRREHNKKNPFFFRLCLVFRYFLVMLVQFVWLCYSSNSSSKAFFSSQFSHTATHQHNLFSNSSSIKPTYTRKRNNDTKKIHILATEPKQEILIFETKIACCMWSQAEVKHDGKRDNIKQMYRPNIQIIFFRCRRCCCCCCCAILIVIRYSIISSYFCHYSVHSSFTLRTWKNRT